MEVVVGVEVVVVVVMVLGGVVGLVKCWERGGEV